MADPILKRIPLNAIRENPVALRGVNRQHADYMGLVDSVKARGILNPILVREIRGDAGEVMYGLIDGLHRFTASLDAGKSDIPAQVMDMDDAQTMEAQLIGNIQKIETLPAQYTKQLQKILAGNPLLTMTQLANKLNKSTTWLNDRLSLTKLMEGIATLVDAGTINLSNAYLLAKLPEEEQGNFVDRAISMSPAEFTPTVLNRKKEIDTARRQGRDPKPAEFTPSPTLQRLAIIKQELDNPNQVTALLKKYPTKTPEDGALLALKWVLHLDPDSVAVAREKDNVRRKEHEQQKIKANAERQRLKAEEAAREAAKVAA